MRDLLLFALLGLGSGAVYASTGLGLVVARRGAEVINFAHGAIAMVTAYVFVDLFQDGEIRLPILGLPVFQIRDGATSFLLALFLALVFAAVLGLALHFLVFGPLRKAPPLARVVASVGVMLSLQGLATLRYGQVRRSPRAILPRGNVEIGGLSLPVDRLWLAAIVVAMTVVLMLLYRRTSFGRDTAVVATSERASAYLGISATRVAALNWMIACLIAGLGGILYSPIAGVDPENYTLAIVPALGAALIGRFESFSITCAAGFGIGMLQGVITKVQTYSFMPDWANVGIKEGLPFILILAAAFLLSPRIPQRGTVLLSRFPHSPRNGGSLLGSAVLAIVMVALLAATSGPARLALIASLLFSAMALSLVVLTGFVGQISLAQAAFAGTAGFLAARLGTDAGLPLPVVHLIALVATVALGLLVGVPALRMRGVTLAVVTLAAGVAIERFLFRNPTLTGGQSGAAVPPLRYGGLDLSPGAGTDFPRLRFGVFVALSVAAMYYLVGVLRRSRLGARMLAVRANENGAAAAGVSVGQTKLLAFCISALIAGWGGIMTAHLRGQVSFESFGVFVSLSILALAYLGGISRPAGAVAGSVVLAAGGIGTHIVDTVLDFGDYTLLVSGLALIITAVLNPNGIAGELAKVKQHATDLWHRRQSERGQSQGPSLGRRSFIDGSRPSIESPTGQHRTSTFDDHDASVSASDDTHITRGMYDRDS